MELVEERKHRERLLRKMMQDQGYQVLVLAGNAEANQRGYIRYLSNWRLWGGKGFIVFPLSGAPSLILGKGSQSYWSQEDGWIGDVRAATDLVQEVVTILTELGLAQGVIGVVGMNEVMTHGDMARVRQHLSGAALVDATGPMDEIMAVKSAMEIVEAAKTYHYLGEAMDAFAAALAPGKSERTVLAAAVQVLAEYGCHDGIAHLTNGPQPYYRPPTDRLIEQTDILKVSLEFAGPSGYWMELSGIFSFREPPERLRRYFETALQANHNAAKVLRPGAKGCELTQAIEATFQAAGWRVTGRAIWDGHAIGLNVIRPPYGLPDSDDEYRENMIINVHPGLMVDDDQWGYVLQDNYVVTPTGGEPVGVYEHRWRVVPA